MKKILIALFLLLAAYQASATTWYIRTDGGTQTQCTGQANAAYPGSGTAQPCAYNHPFWLLDQSAWTWRIGAGDIVQFDAGPYYIGQQNKGLGMSWAHCAGGGTDCDFPSPLPANVSFRGVSYGNCHNSDHTALVNPTKWVGINEIYYMFKLEGATSPDFECFDFSSPETCTTAGGQANNITGTSMVSGTATYSWQWPGFGTDPHVGNQVTISGTTNGGGVFNIANKAVATETDSAYSITKTETVGGVATYTYSVVSGFAPLAGNKVTINGTTNDGGAFNVYQKAVSAVTSTTFQIAEAPTGTIAPQAETGTGDNVDSGYFTVTGLSGTVAAAADTGTELLTGNCVTGQNFAQNGLFLAYLTNQGPSNATIKDVAIHGMAGSGILGTHLNTSPTDVFTASDIYLVGNGSAGWNADGGGCNNSCESQGTMNISYLTVLWSGSVENEPNGGTYGGNGYNYTVDQAFNGYGDGVTMIATGGNWNWSHITSNFNAQDGLDGVHIGDDPVNQPNLTMTDITSIGNEGQSIKGAGQNVTVQNAIGISNCNVFSNASNFPLNGVGWNSSVGLRCRANDSIVFTFGEGAHVTIENVTNIGEQNVGWDMNGYGCTTCVVVFKNNTSMGFVGPSGQSMGGFTFGGDRDYFQNPGSVASNNAWWHINASQTQCPSSGYETAYVCTDPKFVAESDVNAINPKLLAGSPLIGAGIAIGGLTTDIGGNVRPNPPSIGAWEFATNPATSSYFGGSVVIGGSGNF